MEPFRSHHSYLVQQTIRVMPISFPLLQELGGTLAYDMLKDGNEYICNHSGHEIRVRRSLFFTSARRSARLCIHPLVLRCN